MWSDNQVRAFQPRAKAYFATEPGPRGRGKLALKLWPDGERDFYYQWFDADRRRYTLIARYKANPRAPGITLAQARDEQRKLEGKLRDGTITETVRAKKAAGERTLKGWLEGGYARHVKAHNANEGEHLIATIKREFKALLDRDMATISELDITRWRLAKKGVTHATKVRALTYLKACLRTAVKQKVLPAHPLAGITLTRRTDEKVNPEKTRFVTIEEEPRLRAALDKVHATQGEHIKPFVLVGLLTGLRFGDIAHLDWNELDLKRAQLRKVIRKTSHKKANPQPVVLPLCAEAVQLLTDWRARCFEDPEQAAGLVFPSPVNGGPLTSIKTAWSRIQKDAKLPDVRYHDLRHTFASRLVMAGVDLYTVQKLMTHETPSMTQRYAHLAPDHLASAVEKAFGAG